jgi:hypothetical protein
MPKRRRSSWTQRRQRPQHRTSAPSARPVGRPATERAPQSCQQIDTKEALAAALLSDDYSLFDEALLASEPEITSAVERFTETAQYDARLTGEAAQKRLQKKQNAVGNAVALLHRARSKFSLSVRLAAKSITAMFKSKVSDRFFQGEVRVGALMGKAACKSVLALVTALQPGPPFVVSPDIAMFCVDQAHIQQGCAMRGKVKQKRGLERVDVDGERVMVENTL